eukprot:5324712-Pyramimonas_sp.AAC.1
MQLTQRGHRDQQPSSDGPVAGDPGHDLALEGVAHERPPKSLVLGGLGLRLAARHARRGVALREAHQLLSHGRVRRLHAAIRL